jgi:hypothetical protein
MLVSIREERKIRQFVVVACGFVAGNNHQNRMIPNLRFISLPQKRKQVNGNMPYLGCTCGADQAGDL